MFLQLSAQNKRDPCGTTVQYIQVMNGIIFTAKDAQSDKSSELIRFCKNYKKSYTIEGLDIPEHLFLNLHLKQKDVMESKTWYSYRYKNQDTNQCVIHVDFFISLKIPIKLNGVELKPAEKETALQKISTDKIVSITLKHPILSKATVEITTK